MPKFSNPLFFFVSSQNVFIHLGSVVFQNKAGKSYSYDFLRLEAQYHNLRKFLFFKREAMHVTAKQIQRGTIKSIQEKNNTTIIKKLSTEASLALVFSVRSLCIGLILAQTFTVFPLLSCQQRIGRIVSATCSTIQDQNHKRIYWQY